MIDLKSNIEAIEQLMILMEKYKIDDMSVDFLHMKRTKHQFDKPLPTDQELLAKHLSSNETPWMDISSGSIDEWARTGKV